MQKIIQKVVQNCMNCTIYNPKTGPPPIINRVQTQGTELEND